MAIDPKEKYKSLLNTNTFRKRILYIFVFLGILVPSSTVFAATTSITNNTSDNVNSGTCVDKTFSMVSTGTIDDVTIQVDIDHKSRGELDISLTSPLGTSVVLSNDNGGTANNLNALFDDTAATSIVGDNTDHTSTVQRRPEVALNTFDGENAMGTWTLTSCDDTWVASTGRGTFNTATLNITYTATPPPPIESGLSVNFQMDECYWLGGANGVLDDVKDSSGNGLDAQSRNKADNIETNSQICRAGGFVNTYADPNESDAVYYPNETLEEKNVGENAPFTVSAWVYRHADNTWMAGVIKVSDDSWTDGWGLVHYSGSGSNIDFFVGDYGTYARATLTDDTWTHIVGTYDGSTIKIYKNGVFVTSTAQTTYSPGALAVSIGDDISGSVIDDRWQGNIDEVKIWNRALTDSEIADIYNNENAGLNYDGTSRVCNPCNGSSIAGNTWDLIGIPVDSRITPLTVLDVFGDDMNGTLGTDWKIYKRTYSTTDNSSGYEELSLLDTLEFGQGYWLGSNLNSEWYVDGILDVVYDVVNSACQAAQCVEIPLTSTTKDFTTPGVDIDDGTGEFRNNMVGFIGIDKPVEWADCRLIIDGTAYTPSDANASGFANKQIWMYDPSNDGADSKGYTTCDDVTPGGCKLVPFKGFWLQLTGKTKGLDVKLLVPKE